MSRLSHPGLRVLAWPAPRRPAPGGGLAVLVVVTVLAALAAPHAQALRGLVADALPAIAAPERPGARPASGSRPAQAVAFALAQRGKPYRWGAQGPGGFDCSGLAWAAWRAGGLAWPRLTADGQWRRGPRVRGRLRPGDLVFFHTARMPAGHAGHVGVYVDAGRMVEAPAPGALVRVA